MNQVEIKRRQIQLCAMALWLIVLWILGKSIGDNGIAYLAATLEGAALMWAVLCSCVPDALGKLLRGRNTKGQYKNAAKLRHSALYFQGCAGILGSLLFFLLSGVLSQNVFQVPMCKYLLLVLAPVILLRTVGAVLLGIFQGEGSEMPTVVSGILRPFFVLGFGLLFGKILGNYGAKVSRLLGQESFTAMYGGLGVCIAILLSEVLILLFLLLIFKESDKSRRKNDKEDGMRLTDSFSGQISALYGNMGTQMLCTLLLVLPLWLGLIFYQKSAADIQASADSYGLYAGKYITACGMVALLIASVVFPQAMRTAAMLRREERRTARNIFQSGIKTVLIYAMFFSVFFTVMSKQLAAVVGGTTILGEDDLLVQMYTAGSCVMVFGVLAYYCYVILKSGGKGIWIAASLCAADIVYALMLAVLLGNGGNILSLVYAGLGFLVVLSLILCGLVCIQFRTGMDIIRTVAIPMGCVCVAGLISFFLGKVMTPHLGNLVSLVIIFFIAFPLYLVLVVLLRCVTEQELSVIPGGRLLRGIGQLLGVF